jgi:hypothetical protein
MRPTFSSKCVHKIRVFGHGFEHGGLKTHLFLLSIMGWDSEAESKTPANSRKTARTLELQHLVCSLSSAVRGLKTTIPSWELVSHGLFSCTMRFFFSEDQEGDTEESLIKRSPLGLVFEVKRDRVKHSHEGQ